MKTIDDKHKKNKKMPFSMNDGDATADTKPTMTQQWTTTTQWPTTIITTYKQSTQRIKIVMITPQHSNNSYYVIQIKHYISQYFIKIIIVVMTIYLCSFSNLSSVQFGMSVVCISMSIVCFYPHPSGNKEKISSK